jgi:hypothetical protein
VKNEINDLLTDSHDFLNRLKNYYSQLLNAHNIIDVRLIEVHRTKILVPGPSRLEVQIAITNFKNLYRQVLIKFRPN